MKSYLRYSALIIIVYFQFLSINCAQNHPPPLPPPPPAGAYVTQFPTNENPISEGGNWANGETDGLEWHNVIARNGVAYGDVAVGKYSDPVALLTGEWGPDQVVEAIVYSKHPSEWYYQEVELRLRSKITPHYNTGYEVAFRCLKTGKAYCAIVRGNGPYKDWTLLAHHSGRKYGVEDGDYIKATIIGNIIKGYINNVEVISVTFNYGVGYSNRNFGFTYFAAYNIASSPSASPSSSSSRSSSPLWSMSEGGRTTK
jgi:hypothetical protein